MKNSMIYLDSHASTPVDQDVLTAMLPYFTEHYGNGNHKGGWKTNSAMETARNQVSNLIKARPTEIIFTSGATEAINIALLGLAQMKDTHRKHIISQKTEHAAVLQCLEKLEEQGYDITLLEVDAVGRIDLGELKNALRDTTLAVAIMMANNEIGTVQPIEEIGKLCRLNGTKFFCDLTQGIGWHEIDVDKMNIDLAAMSAHKIYGPRGVGALFLRRNHPKVSIAPIIFGGGQERGLRPGTANTPGIVGFGKACELLNSESHKIFGHIRSLRDRLLEHLLNTIEGIKINGCPNNRHPGNINMSIPYITGEDLIGALPNILFSTSSACSSGANKPSHVISALNVDRHTLKGSFRFGIGKFNTIEEIDYVAENIIKTVHQLQSRRSSKIHAVY